MAAEAGRGDGKAVGRDGRKKRPMAVGLAAEVDLSGPDADTIIDTLSQSAYDQVGECADDYLHHVTKEQKADLEAEVQGVIGRWLTRHGLWPDFAHVDHTRDVVE